ncbi:C3HC4-type RING zinc finger protein [Medicago truncatula]|uniref:C3HC4-type RING zinc finger protein n=1 Tax=Medicago truncatula TaxID=3880 RepID=G7LFB4_MEDTR|nr:C3HC4-type RING zinc finger protein [Medicago truncatula]
MPIHKIQDVNVRPLQFQGKNRRVVEEQVECSICLSTPSSTLITRCTHVFCWNCIKKWFDHAKKNLSHVLIVKVYLQVMLLSEDTSTKSKSVVFSRYDDALYYLILYLRLPCFNCLVIYTTKTMICYKVILK